MNTDWKKKLRQKFCYHMFSDATVTSHYDEKTKNFTITNICDKCGKKISFTAHQRKFGIPDDI